MAGAPSIMREIVMSAMIAIVSSSGIIRRRSTGYDQVSVSLSGEDAQGMTLFVLDWPSLD